MKNEDNIEQTSINFNKMSSLEGPGRETMMGGAAVLGRLPERQIALKKTRGAVSAGQAAAVEPAALRLGAACAEDQLGHCREGAA